MRVLVIDDSRAMLAILRKMMTEVGFEVVTAGHARDGLQVLEDDADVGLALVDWNLPEMTGYEFVCEVRAKPAFDHIKLVMVTTETERENIARALEAGANEYIMKPFTRATIIEKLSLLGIAGRTPA